MSHCFEICHYQQNVPQHYYLLDTLVIPILIINNYSPQCRWKWWIFTSPLRGSVNIHHYSPPLRWIIVNYSRGTTSHGERIFPRNWLSVQDAMGNNLLQHYITTIDKNREGPSDDIRKFCCLEDSCLRRFLLKTLDAIDTQCIGLLCCRYCESASDCDECLLKSCQVNYLPWIFIFV